jgi:hypothetical protein
MRNICIIVFIGYLSFSTSYSQNREQPGSGITLNDAQNNLFIEYVCRLQDYPDFLESEKADEIPGWEYAEPSDENLSQLVKKYDLNKVAGKGTEAERWLRLVDWVHRKLFRVGKVGYPKKLNTPSIVEFVENKDLAVNCRMYTIVLNEILLALGYHSRRISFRPIRPDGDTHSLVTVYSKAWEKWVCLDPTFNTFFYDESGEILSYLEIRECYTSGRIPRFRQITIELDWTLKAAGCEFDTYDTWYAVYMAKNCFQVTCPRKSAFGHESTKGIAWVTLLPSGFQPEAKAKPRMFRTNNFGHFFRRPL